MIQTIYEAASLSNSLFVYLYLGVNIMHLLQSLKRTFFLSKITLYKMEIIIAAVIFNTSIFEIFYYIINKSYILLAIKVFLAIVWIMIIRYDFKSLQREEERNSIQ